MSKNTEQKNNETRINLDTVHKDGANQLDSEKHAPVEELIKRAGLEPTLENAQAIYALTNTPEYLLSGLNFEGHHLYRFSKRVFDVAASVLGMCLLSWLIVGTAVAVKVTSPGPIIFKQQRVGKNKKLFIIYKFRTMGIDTPNLPSHMIDANEWLTPVGAIMRRLSLDELPQFWNILKGDIPSRILKTRRGFSLKTPGAFALSANVARTRIAASLQVKATITAIAGVLQNLFQYFPAGQGEMRGVFAKPVSRIRISPSCSLSALYAQQTLCLGGAR